jgi:hypothetical protein
VVPGNNPLMALLKGSFPAPWLNLGFAVVGFSVVAQQIPLCVTGTVLITLTLPPAITEVAVMPVTSAVSISFILPFPFGVSASFVHAVMMNSKQTKNLNNFILMDF